MCVLLLFNHRHHTVEDYDIHMDEGLAMSPQSTDVDMEERMDDHMAALVLTSLSCSPSSPLFNGFHDYHGITDSTNFTPSFVLFYIFTISL